MYAQLPICIKHTKDPLARLNEHRYMYQHWHTAAMTP